MQTTMLATTLQAETKDDDGTITHATPIKIRVGIEQAVDPELFAQWIEAKIVSQTLELAQFVQAGITPIALEYLMSSELQAMIARNDWLVTQLTEIGRAGVVVNGQTQDAERH